jgi:hypothetical protein
MKRFLLSAFIASALLFSACGSEESTPIDSEEQSEQNTPNKENSNGQNQENQNTPNDTQTENRSEETQANSDTNKEPDEQTEINLEPQVLYSNTNIYITNLDLSDNPIDTTLNFKILNNSYDFNTSFQYTSFTLDNELPLLTPTDISINTEFWLSCKVDDIVSRFDNDQQIKVSCHYDNSIAHILNLEEILPNETPQSPLVDKQGNLAFFTQINQEKRFYRYTKGETPKLIHSIPKESEDDIKDMRLDRHTGAISYNSTYSKSFVDSYIYEAKIELFKENSKTSFLSISNDRDDFTLQTRYSYPAITGRSNAFDQVSTKMNNGRLLYQTVGKYPDNEIATIHLYDVESQIELASEVHGYTSPLLLYSKGFVYIKYDENSRIATAYAQEVGSTPRKLFDSTLIKNYCKAEDAAFEFGTDLGPDSFDGSLQILNIQTHPDAKDASFSFTSFCNYADRDSDSDQILFHYNDFAGGINNVVSHKSLGNPINVAHRKNGDFAFYKNDTKNEKYEVHLYEKENILRNKIIATSKKRFNYNPFITDKYVLFYTYPEDSFSAVIHPQIYDGETIIDYNLHLYPHGSFDYQDNFNNYFTSTIQKNIYLVDLDAYVQKYKNQNNKTEAPQTIEEETEEPLEENTPAFTVNDADIQGKWQKTTDENVAFTFGANSTIIVHQAAFDIPALYTLIDNQLTIDLGGTIIPMGEIIAIKENILTVLVPDVKEGETTFHEEYYTPVSE